MAVYAGEDDEVAVHGGKGDKGGGGGGGGLAYGIGRALPVQIGPATPRTLHLRRRRIYAVRLGVPVRVQMGNNIS